MAIRRGERFILGPLSSYNCDGISIFPTAGGYQVVTYEAESRNFDANDLVNYTDAGTYKREEHKGYQVIVYMTDEEMEEFFLAWQILKKEREDHQNGYNKQRS